MGDAAGELDQFERVVRTAVGLDPDPDALPVIWRLGLYRATVNAAAADGSTVDVTPEDPRIKPHPGLELRTGIPGVVFIVEPGAIVRIGWDAGDESKPYAAATWETGASVTKLVLNGRLVILGSEAGAQFIALANLVNAQFNALKSVFTSWTPTPNDGGAALKTLLSVLFVGPPVWPASVAATNGKAS